MVKGKDNLGAQALVELTEHESKYVHVPKWVFKVILLLVVFAHWIYLGYFSPVIDITYYNVWGWGSIAFTHIGICFMVYMID